MAVEISVSTIPATKRSGEEIDETPLAKKIHLENEESGATLLDRFTATPSIQLYDSLVASGSDKKLLRVLVDARTIPATPFEKEEELLESSFLLAHHLLISDKDNKDYSGYMKLLQSVSTISKPEGAWIPSLQQQLITFLYNREGINNSELHAILHQGSYNTRDKIFNEIVLAITNFKEAFIQRLKAEEENDSEKMMWAVEEMSETQTEEYQSSREWYLNLLMEDLNLEKYETLNSGEVRDFETELEAWMTIANNWRPWDDAIKVLQRYTIEDEDADNDEVPFFVVTGIASSVIQVLKSSNTPRASALARTVRAIFNHFGNNQVENDILGLGKIRDEWAGSPSEVGDDDDQDLESDDDQELGSDDDQLEEDDEGEDDEGEEGSEDGHC